MRPSPPASASMWRPPGSGSLGSANVPRSRRLYKSSRVQARGDGRGEEAVHLVPGGDRALSFGDQRRVVERGVSGGCVMAPALEPGQVMTTMST